MTFERMVMLEPGLLRLAHAARHASEHGASWVSYLAASHEALTKLVGRGALDEELQSAQAYETARAAIFAAWVKGEKAAAPVDAVGQTTFLDTTEPYQ